MNNELYVLSDTVASKMESTKYKYESDLQKLVADNPQLLLRESDSEDLKFFLIRREQNIYDAKANTTYSLDHLFIDSDGIPVLVEVKRSSDNRIHREVVGQMLDYSANISVIDMKEIEEVLRREENLQDIEDPDALLQTVRENLQAEHYKLVFVADRIPQSLERLILFLDLHAPNLDCYGVALEMYVSENTKLITKTVVSNNVPAPGKPKTIVEAESWDRDKMKSKISEISGAHASNVLDKMLAFCSKTQLTPSWGKGPKYASFAPIFRSLAFFRVQTIVRKTVVDFCPARMERALDGHFPAEVIREKLIRLTAGDKTYLDDHSDKYVTFDILFFADEQRWTEFEALMQEFLAAVPQS